MVLRAEVKRQLLVLNRYVKVSTFCNLSQQNVVEPEIGCGICHTMPDVFTGKTK